MESAFIGYNAGGKPYDVALRIEESMEGMVRFVAQVMEYTLQDAYGMNIIEFFRDFKRAEKIVEKRKRQTDKMKKG